MFRTQINFVHGINWGGTINAEKDHIMTVARLDDLENCDHRNGMELKIWNTKISYKDFLPWFRVLQLEETKENSFFFIKEWYK